MTTPLKLKAVPLVLLIVMLLIGCDQKADQSDEQILATVGETRISAKEFINSYNAGSSLLKDIDHPRQSFLNAMINEEILAAKLRQDSHYANRPATLKALELLEQELLVERLFKVEVHDKVQVSDTEIRTAILQSNRSIKVKYLETQDLKQASQYLIRLDAGIQFDSLLNGQDTFGSQTYMDSTGFLKYGELEAPLNEVLFNLNPQAYSEVIPLGDAYFIFQNSAMIKEGASEGDIIKYHDRFHKILMYQKRLQASRRFVKAFMDPLEIQVTGESFVFLVNTLYELYVNVPYEQSQILEGQNVNPELSFQNVFEEVEEHGKDPAVRFSRGILTVKELLDQILLKPFHIESSDKQSFAKELNAEIAIALRDYFMEQESIIRGYDQDLAIQAELGQWTEKLLVQNYIDVLRSKIVIPEDEVVQHLGVTTVAGGARLKQAKQQLINLKCKAVLDHQVDSLMTLTRVIIDEDKLDAITVDLPTSKRRPDTYLFKLGLPYLRSAFPTPDPIWGLE